MKQQIITSREIFSHSQTETTVADLILAIEADYAVFPGTQNGMPVLTFLHKADIAAPMATVTGGFDGWDWTFTAAGLAGDILTADEASAFEAAAKRRVQAKTRARMAAGVYGAEMAGLTTQKLEVTA